MRIFFYKTFLIIILIYFLFEITIGYQVRKIEKRIDDLVSKEQFILFKNKLNKEIDEILKKDRILDPKDAKKIKLLLDKLKSELNY